MHRDTVNMRSTKDATWRNTNYQSDVRYVFKLNFWILGIIGIWPMVLRGIGRYSFHVAIAFFNFVLSFTVVPCVLHIVYDQKDLNLRLKLFGLLCFCLTAMTKYCILAIRRPKILHCIEFVKSDWWQVKLDSDRELMLKYAAIGRNLTLTLATIFYISGVIFYLILPFCYEHKISPVYEIVYLTNCMCGYTILSVTSGACGIAALFVTHACGQIQVIMSRLQDLLDGRVYEQVSDVQQQIADIVKDHVRIMRFATVVEEILQEVCLVEFSSSVCVICLLEYYCILDWQSDDTIGLVTYFMSFVSFCFNIYILCYIGELLMEKSSEIGMMCYMSNWYKLPPRAARSLILIIAMSSHPIKLTAGKMADLSLLTFGNVLRTTFAYLSFLRTLVM